MKPCSKCVDYDGAACDWCKRNEYRAFKGMETLTSSIPVVTNYDRTIALPPEELAVVLNRHCPPHKRPKTCEKMSDIVNGKFRCVDCWLSWLKSPVLEEQT